MKLDFTNIPFRHNSACIIQQWLRFKRVITVGLAHISWIFPNGSKNLYLIEEAMVVTSKINSEENLSINFKVILKRFGSSVSKSSENHGHWEK